MNGPEIQNRNEQSISARKSKDPNGFLPYRPTFTPTDEESNYWQYLQGVQTYEVRRSQVSAFCTPIHDWKSWASVLYAHRMRSAGDHHASNARSGKKNNQPRPNTPKIGTW